MKVAHESECLIKEPQKEEASRSPEVEAFLQQEVAHQVSDATESLVKRASKKRPNRELIETCNGEGQEEKDESSPGEEEDDDDEEEVVEEHTRKHRRVSKDIGGQCHISPSVLADSSSYNNHNNLTASDNSDNKNNNNNTDNEEDLSEDREDPPNESLDSDEEED